MLAHQNIRSRCKVGKYGVNLDDIDRIAVTSIIPMKPDEIVVSDIMRDVVTFCRIAVTSIIMRNVVTF